MRVVGINVPILDMSGLWEFNPDPAGEWWEIAVNDGQWSTISVPAEWALEGFKVYDEAGYRKILRIPADWKGKRIRLMFDAVYSGARVWINGDLVAEHIGGFTPFEVDVTENIKWDSENVLCVGVRSKTIADEIANGCKYAKHDIGGILRKPYIIALPQTYIARLHIETDFDEKYRDAILRVFLSVNFSSKKEVIVKFVLIDPKGKEVVITPNTVKMSSLTPERTIEIMISNPIKWDSEHPNLYILRTFLFLNGKEQEVVERRIGFRKVEVKGNKLYINGQPIKLRGICRHEIDPLGGRATQGDWRERKDVKLFREANINFVRTSHYPPAPEFLDLADELGLYVEDEAPVCWAPYTEDPHYKDYFLNAVAEMIERDRSHPSVILWSLGNESKWGENIFAMAEYAAKEDPSRPSIFSYGGTLTNIISSHYPRYDNIWSDPSKTRPVLHDEWAHVNCYNVPENIIDPGLRDLWGKSLDEFWDRAENTDGVLGGCIWAGIDEVFELPHQSKWIGYGKWGIIDGWRRKKPEWWHTKKAYSPIKINTHSFSVPPHGEVLSIPVWNRFNHTNLSEIDATWRVGTETGKLNLNIAPHTNGIIRIPARKWRNGEKLELTFKDKKGVLIDKYKLLIGGFSVRPTISSRSRPSIDQNKKTLSVSGPHFCVVFSKQTGLILKMVYDKTEVRMEGPYLNITESKSGYIRPMEDSWKLKSVQVGRERNRAIVTTRGDFPDAIGLYRFIIDGDGLIEIEYYFSYRGSEVNVREIGLRFSILKKLDTLRWCRKAYWSFYPDNHIGRSTGKARAYRNPSLKDYQYRIKPTWSWFLDTEEAFNTVDFRSTKYNIYSACLEGADGSCIQVRSNGQQHIRTQVKNNRTFLWINDFSNGGDMGWGNYVGPELVLREGSPLWGKIVVFVSGRGDLIFNEKSPLSSRT